MVVPFGNAVGSLAYCIRSLASFIAQLTLEVFGVSWTYSTYSSAFLPNWKLNYYLEIKYLTAVCYRPIAIWLYPLEQLV